MLGEAPWPWEIERRERLSHANEALSCWPSAKGGKKALGGMGVPNVLCTTRMSRTPRGLNLDGTLLRKLGFEVPPFAPRQGKQ